MFSAYENIFTTKIKRITVVLLCQPGGLCNTHTHVHTCMCQNSSCSVCVIYKVHLPEEDPLGSKHFYLFIYLFISVIKGLCIRSLLYLVIFTYEIYMYMYYHLPISMYYITWQLTQTTLFSFRRKKSCLG